MYVANSVAPRLIQTERKEKCVCGTSRHGKECRICSTFNGIQDAHKNASLFLNTESPQDNSKKIHSFINGCTALCWTVAAFSVTQPVGFFGEGISPSQGLYLYKG
jgi:hypothetical protein